MMRYSRRDRISLTGPVVNLITVIVGVVAAYFLTIQSLKVELAAKAEGALVETLDKKMSTLEVILTEGVVGRDQFYRFSKDIEARLTRIELYLAHQSGEKVGND